MPFIQLTGFGNRANISFSLDIPCISVLNYHNITLPEPCITSTADLQQLNMNLDCHSQFNDGL